ncbi:hypothetical protein T4A_13805 [Trichinella pseudospiralis]|uniref:Uncharacterized protein n=1 Tax=Trichinella pseudospiralis TaxID=6337 RepID=A0A0V1DNT1_TRIPS|nr:hypothetical protein T4A_13805 [Trichinella pseudospiralis]
MGNLYALITFIGDHLHLKLQMQCEISNCAQIIYN